MRRSETLLALGAVVLASVAALQVPGRLLFAAGGVALLLAVAGSRLRTAMTRRERSGVADASDRARRIREERNKRLGG